MLVEVKRKEIAKALSVVAKTAGNRSSMPILQGVKLVANGNCLTITTTNLSSWTVTEIAGEVAEPGEYLVDFASLKKVLSKAKSETVILSGSCEAMPVEPETDEKPDVLYTDNHFSKEYMAWKAKWSPVIEEWEATCAQIKEEGILTIEADGSTTLPPMEREQFPVQHATTSTDIATLTGKKLRKAVERAARIALKKGETTRLVLTGANLVLTRGHLEIAATDGYRLIKETIAVDSLEQKTDFTSILIPTAPWNKIVKGIGLKSKVTLGYNEEQGYLTMTTDATTFLIQKICHEFPDIRKVVPSSRSPYKLTVNRMAFLEAIERGEIVSSRETDAITLQAKGDGKLCISSSSNEKGSYHEAIPLLNGFRGTCSISFKGEYLNTFCRQHETAEKIRLILADQRKAGIFQEVRGKGKTCVIMPLQDVESEKDSTTWTVDGALPCKEDTLGDVPEATPTPEEYAFHDYAHEVEELGEVDVTV